MNLDEAKSGRIKPLPPMDSPKTIISGEETPVHIAGIDITNILFEKRDDVFRNINKALRRRWNERTYYEVLPNGRAEGKNTHTINVEELPTPCTPRDARIIEMMRTGIHPILEENPETLAAKIYLAVSKRAEIPEITASAVSIPLMDGFEQERYSSCITSIIAVRAYELAFYSLESTEEAIERHVDQALFDVRRDKRINNDLRSDEVDGELLKYTRWLLMQGNINTVSLSMRIRYKQSTLRDSLKFDRILEEEDIPEGFFNKAFEYKVNSYLELFKHMRAILLQRIRNKGICFETHGIRYNCKLPQYGDEQRQTGDLEKIMQLKEAMEQLEPLYSGNHPVLDMEFAEFYRRLCLAPSRMQDLVKRCGDTNPQIMVRHDRREIFIPLHEIMAIRTYERFLTRPFGEESSLEIAWKLTDEELLCSSIELREGKALVCAKTVEQMMNESPDFCDFRRVTTTCPRNLIFFELNLERRTLVLDRQREFSSIPDVVEAGVPDSHWDTVKITPDKPSSLFVPQFMAPEQRHLSSLQRLSGKYNMHLSSSQFRERHKGFTDFFFEVENIKEVEGEVRVMVDPNFPDEVLGYVHILSGQGSSKLLDIMDPDRVEPGEERERIKKYKEGIDIKQAGDVEMFCLDAEKLHPYFPTPVVIPSFEEVEFAKFFPYETKLKQDNQRNYFKTCLAIQMAVAFFRAGVVTPYTLILLDPKINAFHYVSMKHSEYYGWGAIGHLPSADRKRPPEEDEWKITDNSWRIYVWKQYRALREIKPDLSEREFIHDLFFMDLASDQIDAILEACA